MTSKVNEAYMPMPGKQKQEKIESLNKRKLDLISQFRKYNEKIEKDVSMTAEKTAAARAQLSKADG